jgi:hypothetical protein
MHYRLTVRFFSEEDGASALFQGAPERAQVIGRLPPDLLAAFRVHLHVTGCYPDYPARLTDYAPDRVGQYRPGRFDLIRRSPAGKRPGSL